MVSNGVPAMKHQAIISTARMNESKSTIEETVAKKRSSKGVASFAKYQALLEKYIETKFPRVTKYPRTSSSGNATFPIKELNFLIKSAISSTGPKSDKTITAFLYKRSTSDDVFKLNILMILRTHLLTLEHSIKELPEKNGVSSFISSAKRIMLILLMCAPETTASFKGSSMPNLRRQYSHCWSVICNILFYVRCHLPSLWSPMALACFSVLPKYVLTKIDHPGQFMDLLKDITDGVERTNEHVLFVLALNSLLVLATKFRLDVPNFYSLLFKAMLWLREPHVHYKLEQWTSPFGDMMHNLGVELFSPQPTPKAVLFHLLEVSLIKTAPMSLSSATLPAAFAKRASQLLLATPTPTAMWLIPFIYELIQAHSGLIPLIHKPNSNHENNNHIPCNFVETASDPLQSEALSSSLWELEMVKSHHINASVSSFVSIFSPENFKMHSNAPAKHFQLSKYHDLSYTSMAQEYSLVLSDKPKRTFQCALSVPHPGRSQPFFLKHDYSTSL